MESLRDIRRNIKSIKATRQIMYTMKMVASARMKKAQNTILASRPFADKMKDMLASLRYEMKEEDCGFSNSWIRWICEPREEKKSVGLIIISSDKGLCGAFNANILRLTLDFLTENKGRKIYVFIIGKKAGDFLKRLNVPDIEIVHETIGIFPKAGYVHAELLGRTLFEHYQKYNIAQTTVIYNEFKSLLMQNPKSLNFLPLLPAAKFDDKLKTDKLQTNDFIFEPDKKKFFEMLVPRYVKAQLYRIILESQAAELSARMNAMESASKNAGEIIDELTLKLNRTRQAQITREISEIVGGAEALKS